MEKTIEEIKQLARDIFERGTALDGIDFVHAAVNGADYDPESHFMRIATHLYGKGYRKASDVAREILAEIAKCATHKWERKGLGVFDITAWEISISDIAELKKKYESEGGDER